MHVMLMAIVSPTFSFSGCYLYHGTTRLVNTPETVAQTYIPFVSLQGSGVTTSGAGRVVAPLLFYGSKLKIRN